MSNDQQAYSGPTWDLTTEYQSLQDPQIARDMQHVQDHIVAMEKASSPLKRMVQTNGRDPLVLPQECVQAAQRITQHRYEALTLISNLRTYASCLLSVDGQLDEAKNLQSQVQALQARSQEVQQAFYGWVMATDDETIEAYFKASTITAAERFALMQRRVLRNQRLSLEEEELIITLEVTGPTAWGNLYTDISSSLVCRVEQDGKTETMGLARAANRLNDPDRGVRAAAYRGINEAWETAEQSCAAVLNSLAGWRLDVYKRRSYQQPVHFLDGPAHTNCVTRRTIDAMMGAIASRGKGMGQEALRIRAQVMGLTDFAPWDAYAPAPTVSEGQRYSFEQAMHIIEEAFATVHPEMGEFARMMVRNRWIEGTTGDKKRPGAYCTKFLKSRTPRVYMTYTGSMMNVITLAHELGHAFHNWVMQDLPLSQIAYPMTLAETASIFAQTVVNDALLAQAPDPEAVKPVMWTESGELATFLVDIPTRYTFEKTFYEARSRNVVPVTQIKTMMSQAWKEWYGDTMTTTNEMFWASKLHFHIANLSFYNFPYSFGYLFSLGVFKRREEMGAGFYPAYVDLLRDTGRMTAEDLARKHLGVNLEDEHFWLESLRLIEQKLGQIRTAFGVTH